MQNLFGESVVIPQGVVQGQGGSAGKSGPPPRDPAPFTLTDHIFVTDRRRAWIRYQELLHDGYSPDGDLLPAIWWTLKTAYQVHAGDTRDIKPFVLKKATGLYRAWGITVLHEQSLRFMEMIVDARSDNGLPIEYGLERWLLTLPS